MDDGKSLWSRVCATVTRFGQPRPARAHRASVLVPEIIPDKTIDLHGVTIHTAFHIAKNFIEKSPHTDLLIITGKSGNISYEFPDWCLQWPRVRSCRAINGGGAYRVSLTRLGD